MNWLQNDDGRRFERYIENCSDKDPKFMKTYFARTIYRRGFDDYFYQFRTYQLLLRGKL